jgi:hypothetical protein
MDAVMLLRRAHDAGLRIKPDGDKLRVKGPRRAEAIVELLSIHKAEVLALLAHAGDSPPPIAGETSPAAEPSFWRDFFEERAVHREYNGRYPRIEAEQLAFGGRYSNGIAGTVPLLIAITARAAVMHCLVRRA